MHVLKDSFSCFIHTKMAKLAFVAVPLIIGFFSVFYVTSYLDPTEQMKRMNVAVINQDVGAEVDGEQVNYGNETLDELLLNEDVRWVSEDASLLDQGLESTDYYMALIIPEDFSAQISAGNEGDTQVANLTFWRNERKNYMLAQLTARVEQSLKESISQNVGKEYIVALEEGLTSARDGFNSAADGSAQIGEGAESLEEGLSSAVTATDELETGSQSLQEGTGQLATGAASIKAASASITSGLESLSTQLSEGAAGLDQLSVKLDEAAQSIGSASENGTLLYGTASAQQCIQAAQAALAQGGKYGGRTADEWLALAQGAVQGVDSGLTTLQTGIASGAKGVQAASSGMNDAVAAIGSSDQQGQTLAYASDQVTKGAEALGSGATVAQSGLSQLSEGADALGNGLSAATTGATQIEEGARTMEEELESGAQEIDGGLPENHDEFAEYITAPVDMEEDRYGELQYFGFGFAPFFTAMALWLGSLITFLVVDPFPSLKVKANRFQVVFGRLPLYLMFGLADMIAVAIALYVAGVPVLDWTMMLAVLGVTTLVFVLIMENLNLLFGLPGKAIAVLAMIIQIVAASGTLPVELSNETIQGISAWLPFTYVIDALREVMSGGVWSTVAHDLGMLSLFGVASLVLTLALYPIGLKMDGQAKAQARKALQITTAQPAHLSQKRAH